MAISLDPFERQFLDFGEAIRNGRKPLVGGEEGYQALEIVDAIYGRAAPEARWFYRGDIRGARSLSSQ